MRVNGKGQSVTYGLVQFFFAIDDNYTHNEEKSPVGGLLKSSASIRQSVRSSDYFQLYFTGKYIIIIMQGDTQSVIGLGATENSQPKILIVDDDERTLRLLCAQVSGCGYNYITSTDGTDAVNKAEFANPDVILLDVLIPGISGIETCRQLKGKKETRHIPVITLTSSTDRDVRINCLEAGASDFIGESVAPHISHNFLPIAGNQFSERLPGQTA